MISQKELSYQIISSLRSQGNSDSEILLKGSGILLDSFKKGDWIKSKGSNSDSDILKYSRELLKNWMKKDIRLNGGEKYIPKNPRIPPESNLFILPILSNDGIIHISDYLDKIS